MSHHVRKSKTVLDSRFYAADCGFQVLDSSLLQWNLDRLDSLSCIPDSKAQDFGFRTQNNSRILGSGFPYKGRKVWESRCQRPRSFCTATRMVDTSYMIPIVYRFAPSAEKSNGGSGDETESVRVSDMLKRKIRCHRWPHSSTPITCIDQIQKFIKVKTTI